MQQLEEQKKLIEEQKQQIESTLHKTERELPQLIESAMIKKQLEEM